MTPPLCSIVMSTRNKDACLQRTLESIFSQSPPFVYEIIVVDDGSTDATQSVCQQYGVRYRFLENSTYRNPSVARNVGYRLARGQIVIAQSDDVIHETPNAIEQLSGQLRRGEFLIATVYNASFAADRMPRRMTQYTGDQWKRPFFFLGSLRRQDLYAIGGCDEDFTIPCYDDDWFADCLMHGLGLRPRWTPDVIGLHQAHARPARLNSFMKQSGKMYARKLTAAQCGEIPYCSSGGSWPYPGE